MSSPSSLLPHRSAVTLARGDRPPGSEISHASPGWDFVEIQPLLDFDDLAGILKRRLPWFFLLPALGVAVALVYAIFFATPLYKSTALVFVDPMFDRALQIQPSAGGASDLDSLNSLERAMMSDTMVIRVIDRLELRENPDFLPRSLRKALAEGEELTSSRLVKDLRKKRFSANLIRPTRLIELSVLDPDPERARLIAATFVEEFESFLGDQKRSEAGSATTDLRARAEEAYASALEAEKELEAFRSEHPELTVEQDHQLFAERLTRVGEDLNAVSGRVLNLRSLVEGLEAIDPETEPLKILNLGGFADQEHVSELLGQRASARTALATIRGQFTERHPRFQEASSRVEELEAQVKELAAELKESLRADYEAALVNETYLTERVGELQTQLAAVKSASSRFRAIQQRVETEWTVHQSLRERIGQTSIESEKASDVTRLMSEPIAAHKPSTPKKSIAAAIGAFGGGFLCFGLVGGDLLRGGPFRSRRQIERRLDLPVVAEIDPPGSESRDLRIVESMTRLLLSPDLNRAGSIHISSLWADEEGLRLAACLASASARHGWETLLVSVAPDEEPRIPQPLVPRPSRTERLHTLRLPSSFLLSPQSTWQLLGPQRQRFERIIIESTAFSQESRIPSAVAAFSDANLVLVERQRGDRREVEEGLGHLARSGSGSVSLILQG